MKIGDTFYLRGPENPKPHLWVVVSDPSIDPYNVVFVNFTKNAPHKDQTCVLPAGTHDRLPLDSCVYYAKAYSQPDASLERAKSIGKLDPQTPLAKEALRKVQQGAARSEDMRIAYRQILIDQGLCDAG